MKSSNVRAKFLEFYNKNGHAVIPSAPIVPPDDPTTLFTSSGMQQLVPYLKGEKHPMGTRLADSQPCFRADDIEEVGDNRHTCMFEMLGNWSLGDYFKKEQLAWVWELYTVEFGLAPERLYVTVFGGDAGVEEDKEAIELWQKIIGTNQGAKDGEKGFDKNTKIYTYKDNWWSRAGSPDQMPVGEIGGPDSEIFFDFGEEHGLHENSQWASEPCHINCDCGRFLEIGNSVFMQFVKTAGGMKPLPAQNVDFGGGLERIVAATENTPDIFMTDMFLPVIKAVEASSGQKYEGDNMPPMRVIADHLRAAVFMGAQGVVPSNKLQGYVMRRLLRRAAVRAKSLGADAEKVFRDSVPTIVKEYAKAGFLDESVTSRVIDVISQELTKFAKALARGEKEIEKRKIQEIDETLAFDLYQSYGFPFEITRDLVKEKGIELDEDKFNKLFEKHKQESRTASSGMFKGGLADHGETTTKYHTATHLLHQALTDVLGDEVKQAGSNISAERLRFDYTYSNKPTQEELKKVEDIVNAKTQAKLPVKKTIMDKQDALDSGAKAFFVEKYPDQVSVYTIGNSDSDWYSRELCGGPHVENTSEIGKIEIFKEESVGRGVRRLYAKLA